MSTPRRPHDGPDPDSRPMIEVSLPDVPLTERLGRTRRLRSCVQNWPDCETGGYNPSCCRFPSSCSATIYDESTVRPEDLEDLLWE